MAWIKLKDEAPTTDCKVDIVMYNGKREVDVNYDKQRNEFYKYKDELLPGVKTIFLVSYWQPVPILPCEGNHANSNPANCAIFDVSDTVCPACYGAGVVPGDINGCYHCAGTGKQTGR